MTNLYAAKIAQQLKIEMEMLGPLLILVPVRLASSGIVFKGYVGKIALLLPIGLET